MILLWKIKIVFYLKLYFTYNFGIKDAARKCVCGNDNLINHSLICKRGGYVSLRHNSLRDVLAELLETAGCKDVTIEPLLIPVNGRELPAGANKAEGARLDVLLLIGRRRQ